MMRPREAEYAPFFHGYVQLVPELNILDALESQVGVVRHVASMVSKEQELFFYAPGKWTIRQVAGHLGDGERVFGFRAFSFSRLDETPLPGFDENGYVERSRSNDLPLTELVEDFIAARAANLRLLKTLTPEQWRGSGTANGKSITVRALAYVMVGHVRHHLHLLKERYGIIVA